MNHVKLAPLQLSAKQIGQNNAHDLGLMDFSFTRKSLTAEIPMNASPFMIFAACRSINSQHLAYSDFSSYVKAIS